MERFERAHRALTPTTRVRARFHDLFALPEPGLDGALVDETAGVLRGICFADARWGDFSLYEVFPTSRAQLLVVASRLSRLDSELDGFRPALAKEPGLDARLAEIFVDASLCSNFSAEAWRPLLAIEPSFIVLAAEYCVWVLAASGADGAEDFRALVTDEYAEPLRAHRDVLLSPFGSAVSSMDWTAYVDRLIAFRPIVAS